MRQERFVEIITSAMDRVIELVKTKGVGKYATKEDALHNFRSAAQKRGWTLGQALQGMADKHEIVVDDMVSGVLPITEELITEHAVDRVTYAILMIPVLYEMMEMQEETNECDTCSAEDVGYERAIEILQARVKHRYNMGAPIGATLSEEACLEELRKERR